MNFLAHFHLSPSQPDAIAGAFLGDFVRGKVDDHADLPLTMRQGITLHRRIDAYTDSHPTWQRSAHRLAPKRRRLGGIVVDVLYDHYLCLHWETFSKRPLTEFAAYCYECLLSRTQFMEAEVRRIVRRMREYDWLTSYQTVEGIAVAFRRMSLRTPILAGIGGATEDFRTHYRELELDFLAFYPDLVSFARQAWTEITS